MSDDLKRLVMGATINDSPNQQQNNSHKLLTLVDVLSGMHQLNEVAAKLSGSVRYALKFIPPDDLLAAARLGGDGPAYEVVFPIVQEYRAQQEAKLRSASYVVGADTDLKDLVR